MSAAAAAAAVVAGKIEARAWLDVASKAALIIGAWCLPPHGGDATRVMVARSSRDVKGDRGRVAITTHTFSRASRSWSPLAPFPLEVPDVKMIVPSPSGRYIALVRKDAAAKDGKAKQYVDVWDSGHIASSCVLPEDAHGAVIADGGWFSSFDWSPDERFGVYVAETREVKVPTYFDDDKAASAGGEGASSADSKKSGAGPFDLREPKGYIICFETGRVVEIPGVPDTSMGQVVFSRDGRSIAHTSWSHAPRKLGMIYCHQRPCSVFVANVESVLLKAALPKDAAPSTARDGAKAAEPKPAIVVDHVKISGDWVAARSPVFSNSGKDVAFLGSNMSSHNGCCALCVAAVPAAREGVASQPRTVLPVVGACAPLGAFPGIYAVRLPRRAWATDDASILVNTHWASALAAVRVDVRSGATERLISGPHGAGAAGDTAAPGARASVYVADTCGDDALLVVSSFDSPDAVQLAVRGDGASVNREGAVLPAAGEAPLRSILEAVEWRVLPVAPRDGGPAFETTLLLPRGARGLPLLVMPHGGPHSSWTTEFLSSIAFLVGQGFAVSLVNYRGSLGFGSDALESLLGRIGAADVADMYDATQETLRVSGASVDASRVGVVGGSHGGFLAAHLIGQYPELFKAAVLRNPVTNIAAMASVTDIPDWCFIETGRKFDFNSANVPSADDLAAMWAASPIAHIARVKAPTLLVMGAKDRRVPPSQGLEFFHALRARGVQTRCGARLWRRAHDPACSMLWYADAMHAIDTPLYEGDCWVNVALWMKEHLRAPA